MRKIISIAALLLPATTLANGYDVIPLNPRDLAMVGSVVADQKTAGAAFGNPSALSKIEGLSLDVAANILDIRTTWNDTTGAFAFNHAQTDVKPAPPPSLSIAYGTKVSGHGLGVGFSFTIPGGGNVFWPTGSATSNPFQDSWPGRYRIITVDRKVHGLYFTGGYEVAKWLRVGGGLIYYRTTEELVQAFTPLAPDMTARLTASGGALSYDLSAEITPFEDIPLAFGIDYKHQGVQNLTGEVRFSNVPPALQAQAQDQGVSHELTFPNWLNIGAAYRVVPRLLLTFTWTFNRYAMYDKDTFVGSAGTIQPIVVRRDYSNGQVYRFGAEWSTTDRLKLRAGFLRDISGMPKIDNADGLVSPTYSATLPDSNAWAAAVGFGYDIMPNFTVQAAVFHAWMDDVRSSNTDPAQAFNNSLPFPGLYQTHVWVYGAGIVYRWDPHK